MTSNLPAAFVRPAFGEDSLILANLQAKSWIRTFSMCRGGISKTSDFDLNMVEPDANVVLGNLARELDLPKQLRAQLNLETIKASWAGLFSDMPENSGVWLAYCRNGDEEIVCGFAAGVMVVESEGVSDSVGDDFSVAAAADMSASEAVSASVSGAVSDTGACSISVTADNGKSTCNCEESAGERQENSGNAACCTGAYPPATECRTGDSSSSGERVVDIEISEFFVLPEVERQGHGSRLMAAVADYARARGCTRLRIWILESDEPRQRFFNSCGFAPQGSKARMPVKDGFLTSHCWVSKL